MNIKSTFIIQNIANSQIMVQTGNSENKFSGFLKSNESAAFIVNCLKEETTKEELIQKLLDEYDVDESTALKSVDYVISQLNVVGALDN